MEMNPQSTIRNWLHRFPLTLKTALLTIMTGLVVWTVLDYVQTYKLRNIFHAQLTEKLDQHAMEARLSFDSHVNAYQESVKLFVAQGNFINYIERQGWSAEETMPIKYHRRLPPWFPKRSVLKAFIQPRYAVLLDSRGKVREIYQSRQDTLPSFLFAPPRLLIEKSHNQSFMTRLDGLPYLVTSESAFNPMENLLATLILASPIDDEFLIKSLGPIQQDHLVALLTSEQEPRVLTSNNLEKLPPGTPLKTIKNRYLVTGKEFFDYGASELQIKFTSLVSITEIDLLSKSLTSRARQERAVLAFAFILIFASIMYWITEHIQQLTRQIADFSHHTLGMKPQEIQTGYQWGHPGNMYFHRCV